MQLTSAIGATVITCGNLPQDREQKCAEVIAETGANFVSPYNDEVWSLLDKRHTNSCKRVIAGQGTATLEMLEQANGVELDAIITPVGGGGLVR